MSDESFELIVAYVPDLMDRSKVQAAAGDLVQFVADPKTVVDVVTGQLPMPALVLFDLSRDGVIDAIGALRLINPRPKSVGFGSHKDRARLDEAKAVGCDKVVARSEFFRRLVDLLT